MKHQSHTTQELTYQT